MEIINEEWIRKDMEGSGNDFWMFYPRMFLKETRKTTNILARTTDLGQDLYQGPPRFEAGVLHIQSQCSVQMYL
jgi:hypothetical protein